MRQQIAAANWKMNLGIDAAQTLLNDIVSANITPGDAQQVVFAVPFPYLTKMSESLGDKERYAIAAQNCSDKKSGAYTGETSVEMLQSIGIRYCVIGHSERREYFAESNAMLASKLDLCLQYSITPIFCCGEPLLVREANEQNKFVEQQLEESLFHLDETAVQKVVIAYEPIWAIGTGKTASTEQAQEMHAHLRKVLAGKWGEDVANSISILYGGSVKASNAADLFVQPDVDGGLVGGASLQAQEFVTIIKSLKQ